MKKIRLIAYYLPQFHPIKENDEWHGEGFTEWTNVGKAKPLFKGHDQPRVPADLGYYDLRLPSVRLKQAEMAQKYGIDGFCYWHYWFGNGKRLLELPFNEVLKSGSPDFPFSLAWANETWKGVWHGVSKGKILIEQKYPGEADFIAHFNELLPAFRDKRYIRINDKPIFTIYKPLSVEKVELMIQLWQRLATENGLKGIYFIAHTTNQAEIPQLYKLGYDGINLVRLYGIMDKSKPNFLDKVFHKLKLRYHTVFPYQDALRYFSGDEDRNETCYPTLIPNWDHSPRSATKGYILTGSTPELFRRHIRDVFSRITHKQAENQVVFVKSWNEWGEGNYLEPDLRFGRKYLEVLADEKARYQKNDK